VVRAVIKGGLSWHQAAAQFSVGIGTAINWVRRFHETENNKPHQVGGYRSKKIAVVAPRLACATLPDRRFCRARAELVRHGLKVNYRTMWEFVRAEKISYKKDADCRRTEPSRRPGVREHSAPNIGIG
jgi:putative transposase